MSSRRAPRPAARALRAALYAGGLVAAAAGGHTALAGARSLPGEDRANPTLESELRYYAGFYAAFGLAALRLAPSADREPEAVRALAAAMFGAGLARAGGWVAAGAPHPVQRALLALELGAPPALVALQRRVGPRR
jgi:hypothetical protein